MSVKTDELGNILSIGYFSGTANFDPENSDFSLDGFFGKNIYISKLDSSGNFNWARQLRSNNFNNNGTSLILDDFGSIIYTGYFSESLNFNPDFNNFTLTSNGNEDIFISKLSLCPEILVVDEFVTCDSFTWIDGITYTESNNTATVTLPNAAGCDSVVALNLTINQSNTGIDVINACEPYTWIDGVTYTESNNTATFTIPNAANCDSVVTLNLTIQSVDNSVSNIANVLTANATNATYQWLNCNDNFAVIDGETAQTFTAASSGSYAVEITQNGCVDTSACFTITNVSINSLASDTNIRVYPNPSNGEIFIDLSLISEVVEIEIFDYRSSKINASKSNGNSIEKIELRGGAGVYFVKIKGFSFNKVFKILKQD